MLNLDDVKGIAIRRFFRKKPWKWTSLIMGIIGVWVLIGFVSLLAWGLCTSATDSQKITYTKYVIPWAVIEQNKDIEVVYGPNKIDTVNGYVLKTPPYKDDTAVPNPANIIWIWGLIVMTPMFGGLIFTITSDYKLARYTDKFTEMWADTKDLPDI